MTISERLNHQNTNPNKGLSIGEFSNEIKTEKRYLMISGYHNFVKDEHFL